MEETAERGEAGGKREKAGARKARGQKIAAHVTAVSSLVIRKQNQSEQNVDLKKGGVFLRDIQFKQMVQHIKIHSAHVTACDRTV